MLENRVAELKSASVAQNRAACDALSITRVAERRYASYQLKVSGLPQTDLTTVQRGFKSAAAKFGFSIDLDAVCAVRPCSASSTSSHEPPGSDDLSQRTSSQAPASRHNIFVTFKYAGLRDIMLSRFRDSSLIRVIDLDPTVRDCPALDGVIKVFEVLSPERYASFLDVRRRAAELRIAL